MQRITTISLEWDDYETYNEGEYEYMCAEEFPFMVNVNYNGDTKDWYMIARFQEKEHAQLFAQKLQQQSPDAELIDHVE